MRLKRPYHDLCPLAVGVVQPAALGARVLQPHPQTTASMAAYSAHMPFFFLREKVTGARNSVLGKPTQGQPRWSTPQSSHALTTVISWFPSYRMHTANNFLFTTILRQPATQGTHKKPPCMGVAQDPFFL